MDAVPLHPAAPASAARDTVLVVEDDQRIAQLLACIVGRDRLQAIHAPSGAECRAVFATSAARIALVILDGTLPDTDGVRLCRELRAQAAGLPVLFVSGRDVQTMAEGAASGGPTGFVAKPFFPADILRGVRALIGRAA